MPQMHKSILQLSNNVLVYHHVTQTNAKRKNRKIEAKRKKEKIKKHIRLFKSKRKQNLKQRKLIIRVFNQTKIKKKKKGNKNNNKCYEI